MLKKRAPEIPYQSHRTTRFKEHKKLLFSSVLLPLLFSKIETTYTLDIIEFCLTFNLPKEIVITCNYFVRNKYFKLSELSSIEIYDSLNDLATWTICVLIIITVTSSRAINYTWW